MHLINQHDTWFWELQVNCNTTTTTSHHIIPRLVQPSNQSTCFHRKTSATTTSCPFWLDRPDSFFTFTSTACAFRKQRINVTIPFTTLSNYLTLFFLNQLLYFVQQPIWEEYEHHFFTFMFHGLSGTVSIDRALSRRLNIIHHTSISVSVLDLLVLRWIRRVGNIESSLGERESKPRIPQEQMGIMSTDHSVLTGMENEIPCLLLLLQSINAIRNELPYTQSSSLNH